MAATAVCFEGYSIVHESETWRSPPRLSAAFAKWESYLLNVLHLARGKGEAQNGHHCSPLVYEVLYATIELYIRCKMRCLRLDKRHEPTKGRAYTPYL